MADTTQSQALARDADWLDEYSHDLMETGDCDQEAARLAATAARIRAYLSSASHVESGAGDWVMVPREPTEAMLISGCAIPGVSLASGERMYRAMIAAAPPAPTVSADSCQAILDNSVAAIAALLLGRVNAPEQEIYRAPRDIVGLIPAPTVSVSRDVTDEMVEAGARALIARYRSIWPGAGWPAMREGKLMAKDVLTAALKTGGKP